MPSKSKYLTFNVKYIKIDFQPDLFIRQKKNKKKHSRQDKSSETKNQNPKKKHTKIKALPKKSRKKETDKNFSL
jgi:hypothetical protein